MGLFSTLGNTQSMADRGDTKTSSLAVATVVQLYTDQTRPFVLDWTTAQIPSYAHLTYQSVQVSALLLDGSSEHAAAFENAPVLESPSASGLRLKKANTPMVPDLGVWDCCVVVHDNHNTPPHVASEPTTTETTATTSVPATAALIDSLLQIPDATAVSTFSFVVDLAMLGQVEPSLTRMQEALIRYLITTNNNDAAAATTPATTTTTETMTTLQALKSVQFGLAINDTSSSPKETPDHVSDAKVAVRLVICARMAPPRDASAENNDGGGDDYQAKQAQALLVYHLRKYAAALNACLLFVQPEGGTTNTTTTPSGDNTATTTGTTDKDTSSSTLNEQPAASLAQLACFWKELAQGKEAWKEAESVTLSLPADESETTPAETTSAHALMYGPGNHNEDLIESVLLRGASYPGHWDAATDSVWKILPPTTTTTTPTTTASATKGAAGGDADWLTELRESIVTQEAAPQTPSQKSAASTAEAKTPSDAGVSSFFENLLKEK